MEKQNLMPWQTGGMQPISGKASVAILIVALTVMIMILVGLECTGSDNLRPIYFCMPIGSAIILSVAVVMLLIPWCKEWIAGADDRKKQRAKNAEQKAVDETAKPIKAQREEKKATDKATKAKQKKADKATKAKQKKADKATKAKQKKADKATKAKQKVAAKDSNKKK